MKRRLLITGGAGFIGANFTHAWSRWQPEDRIVVLDALTYAGNFANIETLCTENRVRFIRGDIRDYDLVRDLLRSEQIDTIVHFAAESHVDRSIHGPAEFIQANVVGTQVLLDAARNTWPPSSTPRRFHHISTDEVYGSLGPDDPPFTESHPYDPRSPYAASKAASDHLVRAYGNTYGLDFTISNCSNNYGPYQFPEKLIPLCILNALEGRALPIYGDGLNVRDWLHVGDHCAAIRKIIDSSPTGRTWNVGGGTERTNIALVEDLCAAIDAIFTHDAALKARFPNCPASRSARTAELITYVKDRPGHDRRYAIDSQRLQHGLGWRAETDLASGLKRTVTWYVDNQAWWRAVLTGEYREWVTRQYAK
jgi:dTDP-glucose 4,6-dehydratase